MIEEIFRVESAIVGFWDHPLLGLMKGDSPGERLRQREYLCALLAKLFKASHGWVPFSPLILSLHAEIAKGFPLEEMGSTIYFFSALVGGVN
jgi:hypothetical protein